MTSGEDYVLVRGTVKRITAKAFLLVKGVRAEGWVARSCCHHSTDEIIDRITPGYEGEFKIMRWVAEKAGFL